MKISLIAIDLDGTLLTNAKTVSAANRNAVRRAASRGAHIALASGRMPSRVVPTEDELGIDCCLMAYNGAAGFGRKADGRQRLFHRPLPPGFAGRIIDVCMERRLLLNVYVDEILYGIDDPALQRHAALYREKTGALYTFVPDYERFRNAEPSKLLIVTDPGMRNVLYDELHPQLAPEIRVVKSDPEYLEFLHPQADKGSGLRALCDAMGIPIEETVAFGDAENDIEFLAAAGCGICMANGEPKTKAAADVVSAFTNEEDGVARELARLL